MISRPIYYIFLDIPNNYGFLDIIVCGVQRERFPKLVLELQLIQPLSSMF